MHSELCLSYLDEYDQPQQMIVTTNPFSIGRGDNNDLVLSDSGLSRRHVLITKFGEDVQVSDCGSQNGTLVNGQLIRGSVTLKDGDTIAIGASCKINVRLTSLTTAPNPLPAPAIAPPTVSHVPPASPAHLPAPPAKPAPGTFSPVVLAIGAVAAIFIVAGGLVFYRCFFNDPIVTTPSPFPSLPPLTQTPIPTVTESSSVTPSIPPPAHADDQFVVLARQAVLNISNDQNYNFPRGIPAEIKRRAELLAKPELTRVFQAINSQGKGVAAIARNQGLNPAFVIFLGLTQTNGGRDGDPLTAVRTSLPQIKRIRATMGVNSGDDALLAVAASQISWGSGHAHSLVPVLEGLMKEVNVDPQRDRSVWFLHSRGKLNETVYEFVLRFLAYGAIAQNPRQFGLDAPALVF